MNSTNKIELKINENASNDQEIIEKVNKQMGSTFLENRGQISNKEVLFYGTIQNGKIGFCIGKIIFWIEDINSFVEYEFVNAEKIKPIAVNELTVKSNFFLGSKESYSSVRNFNGILYENLWNGIDLFYKITPLGIKYEFRIAPSGDPKDIWLKCSMFDSLTIEKQSLAITKDKVMLIDNGLTVLQEDKIIEAEFILKDKGTFGFKIEEYNKEKPLIIDPLLYSTFIGGNAIEEGFTITLDDVGNIYVAGFTSSVDFPIANALNDTLHDLEGDCFVSKFSREGVLLYSTFIGGSAADKAYGLAVDTIGNIYLGGNTYSVDFPITENAFDKEISHKGDIFVLKLSHTGDTLLYSTFLGGLSIDSLYSLAIDGEGNAFLSGTTESTNFPTTAGAFDETHESGDAWDCFVTKLANNGSKLLYSTIIGGIGDDFAHSIAVSEEGNAIIAGRTNSHDYPTTEGVYNQTHSTYYYYDCFVTKLSTNGSSLIFSTFVGGSNHDQAYTIAIDTTENIFVAGVTKSENFPITTTTFDCQYNGNSDGFVFKISADGSHLLYSTFIGGSNLDTVNSIVVDSSGNAYICGTTQSSDFPVSLNAYSNYKGSRDIFVSKLATNEYLLYSTIIGGSNYDIGNAIILNETNNIIITGYTYSPEFPTTAGAEDEIYDEWADCYVLQLSFDDSPTLVTQLPITSPTPTETPTETPTNTSSPTVTTGIFKHFLSLSISASTIFIMLIVIKRRRKQLI